MGTVVVKLGSSIVADDAGEVRLDVLGSVCDEVAARREAGDSIVLVTSGAIARGMRLMDLPMRPSSMEELQAASAVGQGKLYRHYDELLQARGVKSAQVLRDFVEATNERDGDTLCGDLLTQDYKEGATGATGEQADEACRQLLDVTTGLKLRLIRLGKVEIDGEKATARAVIDTDGVEVPRLFMFEREDGKWKLGAGSSG